MPYNIQVRLKQLRMKQTDLWDEVRANGFKQLSEQLFSRMVRDKYPSTPYAESVLKTADALLTKREKRRGASQS